MATTEIHAITTTPNKALNYILADKIVEIKSDDEINKEIPYSIEEKNGRNYVHYYTITGFQNCSIQNPFDAYKDRQEKWQGVRYKNGGSKTKSGNEPVMYHLHQSFEGFEVSYETANEIGRKLAEEIFSGYVVTVSTHGNTDNIHNHFMISAWDENGKKWNDCHETKRLIRNVSDRLCKEYGLSVLEHTRDMKLIKYKDTEGKTHYYEPTDRKNNLIQKRESGLISTDDVGSYRNRPVYEETQGKKQSNRDEIKADIDILLPGCRNYEELLERLRELGYIIKDKKKNGEWLQHISFQAPTQEKATREDKIGDGQFYLRENLQRYIKEQADLNRQSSLQPAAQKDEFNHGEDNSLLYHSEYIYGTTDLSKISNDFKIVLDNGEYKVKGRTDVEKKVISDIRKNDIKVRGLIDTTQLKAIILSQSQSNPQKGSGTLEQRLVAQIQDSFRCLKYAEQHNIYGYEQIISLYAANKAKYDATIVNYNKAEQAIDRLKDLLAVPDKLNELLYKVECNKDDVSYILEEYDQDKKNIARFRAIMEKYKIDTQQGKQALENKVSGFEAKQDVNRNYMRNIITQMGELENCIRVFDRIDSERNARNEKAMSEFNKMMVSYKKEHQKER